MIKWQEYVYLDQFYQVLNSKVERQHVSHSYNQTIASNEKGQIRPDTVC